MSILLPLLFIINEIYYVLNMSKLNENFNNKDIDKISLFDLIYYILRFGSWMWIIVGTFYNRDLYIILLFIFGFIKFPLYHINRKSYNIYGIILPIVSIFFYIAIFMFQLHL